jgi:hypothetical protein
VGLRDGCKFLYCHKHNAASVRNSPIDPIALQPRFWIVGGAVHASRPSGVGIDFANSGNVWPAPNEFSVALPSISMKTLPNGQIQLGQSPRSKVRSAFARFTYDEISRIVQTVIGESDDLETVILIEGLSLLEYHADQ